MLFFVCLFRFLPETNRINAANAAVSLFRGTLFSEARAIGLYATGGLLLVYSVSFVLARYSDQRMLMQQQGHRGDVKAHPRKQGQETPEEQQKLKKLAPADSISKRPILMRFWEHVLNTHIYFSLLKLKPYATKSFTKTERLTVTVCMLYTSMAATALFFGVSNTGVNKWTQLVTCHFLMLVPGRLVSGLFKHVRQVKEKKESGSNDSVGSDKQVCFVFMSFFFVFKHKHTQIHTH